MLVHDLTQQVHKMILGHTSWFKNKKGKSKNKALDKTKLDEAWDEWQFQGDL